MARKKRKNTEQETEFDDLMEDFFRAGDEGSLAWEDEEDGAEPSAEEASGSSEGGAPTDRPAAGEVIEPEPEPAEDAPETGSDSSESAAKESHPVAGEVFEPEPEPAEEAPPSDPDPEPAEEASDPEPDPEEELPDPESSLEAADVVVEIEDTSESEPDEVSEEEVSEEEVQESDPEPPKLMEAQVLVEIEDSSESEVADQDLVTEIGPPPEELGLDHGGFFRDAEPSSESMEFVEAPEEEAEASPSQDEEAEASVLADPAVAPAVSGRAPEDDEAVRERITLLAGEAAQVGGADKAGLLVEAARLSRLRLGNVVQAERYAREAVGTGAAGTAGLRELSAALAMSGNWDELCQALANQADSETEAKAAAELLQDAALVSRHQLHQDDQALALLKKSLERSPDDHFSLKLLRDLYETSEAWEQLVETLVLLAGQTGGTRAAMSHTRRGQILAAELSDTGGAIEAYKAALEANPEHQPALLGLEALIIAEEDWAGLAGFYTDLGTAAEGGDAWLWLTRAGDVHAYRTEDLEKAAEAYGLAVQAGAGPEVRHRQQRLAASLNRWDGVVEELRAEVESADEGNRPFVQYRLARVLDRYLEDSDGALEVYREVATDPAALPAASAVVRILSARQDWKGLLDFWTERIQVLDDPNLKVTLEFRMGEICEGRLDDQDGAKLHFENILEIAGGYLPALEGLERVYTRLAEWDSLAALYEQRAILCEEPGGVALHLHRAGAVCEFRLADLKRARDFYNRALDHVPDFPPSLDAYLRLLEGENDWAGLAQVLVHAAEATEDSNEVVSYLYRAARIQAEKVEDHTAATESLRRCLELSPGFLPAHLLLKELMFLQGTWDEVQRLQLQEAEASDDLERRHWMLLDSAYLADQLGVGDSQEYAQKILAADGAHPGALALVEQAMLSDSGAAAMVEFYRKAAEDASTDTDRARISALVADALRDTDPIASVQAVSDVLAAEDAEDRPLLALAVLCESLGMPEQAQRTLEVAGRAYDAARLQEQLHGDGEEALAAYLALLDDDPDHEGALTALERLQQAAGDKAGLAATHERLAAISTDPAVQVVHATFAGHLFEGVGDFEKAQEAYQLAFDRRPMRGKSADGLRRLMLAAGDADALAALHDCIDPVDYLIKAEDLLDVGAFAAAAEAAVNAPGLPGLLLRGQAQEELEDWVGLFETLRAQAGAVETGALRTGIQERMRRLLAERLAETDEAWNLYRQLHEEDPENREVLEALARIAETRGEAELAQQYLGGLASTASEPAEAARIQRHLAELHEAAEDLDAARAAFFAALDYLPEDREALAGLRRLAENTEDWNGMVGVLGREATLAQPEDQAGLFREIALIWEVRIGEPDVAIDAWRKVLEVDADNVEALEHLVELSQKSNDWTGFVEVAHGLVRHREGPERSALLRRIGLVHAERLRRDDEALRYLDGACAGEHPDLEAARALEALRAARGEWEHVVEALRRQALALPENERGEPLLKAARIKLDTLHNRDDAAVLYDQVLEQDAQNVDALRFLSDYRFDRGDLAASVELYEQLEADVATWDLDDFDVQIEAAQYYYHFAQALLSVDRTADAETRLGKALDLNGTHLPSLKAVGPLYVAAREWKKAEKVYRQLLQLIGGSGDLDEMATVYTRLGEVERALGKMDKAKKRFNKALEIRPNDIIALRGIGNCMYDAGEWNNLLNIYNNIIYHAREPGDVINAYLTKGHVLDARMGLPEKAAQHYQKILSFNPNQPAALLRLGELALRQQDWFEADSVAGRALEEEVVTPTEEGLLRLLRAIALVMSEDREAAAEEFDKARETDVALSEAIGKVDLDAPEKLHELLRTRLLSPQP